MDPIVNMIVNDENASSISNKIKEVLYSKAAENIEQLKPYVASSLFGDGDYEEGEE